MENLDKPIEERIPDGWTNPPDLEELKADFHGSKNLHDTEVAKRDLHLEYLHLTGSQKVKAPRGRSQVQPRLIRKHGEWRYAALSEAILAGPDLTKLSPRTHADKKSSRENMLLINYQWNNVLDKTRIVDTCVRAGVDEGTVFYRVGWESETEEVIEIEPIYNYYPAQTQDQVQELMSYAQLRQADPAAFKQAVPEHFQEALNLTEQQGQPIYPELVEEVEVPHEVLIKNQPTLEVCNLANVYPDPLCGDDLSKAQFLVYSFESCKSELRKEGDRYFNLDQIKISKTSLYDADDHEFTADESTNFSDDPRTKFVVYEYWGFWDVDDSGITTPIVVSWVGDVIIRMEENPYPDKQIPFVSNSYLPRRYSLYGDPDGYLLRDQQSIIGAVTRGAIDSMARSANAQRGMRQDALDTVNMNRYKSGEDYFFNPNVDPRNAIIDHTYNEIPNSVSLMLNLQELDANNITGVRPFGATDSSAGTATADRGVLDAATKRETGILRRYASAFSQIARKICAMNAEFLSDEEIIRITDEDYVTIRREDLAGNFDFDISISTAEEDAAKAQELAFMLQTMGDTIPIELKQTVLSDIATLRRMPQLARKIEQFRPAPDPVAEALKKLEVAKIEAEIRKIHTESDKNNTTSQLNMAKAGEAGAKTGNIQSKTDQQDLDFINKQTGVDHAREIQKDQAQAQGNMALEILKSDLNPKPQTGN